jgi:cation-transporting ATPase 13A1
MERGLHFDGFLAFACPVRTDTPEVIQALRASSHVVMMATGDSALTALHVANEVGIAEGGLEHALMLVPSSPPLAAPIAPSPSSPSSLPPADDVSTSAGHEHLGGGGLEWVSAKTDEKTNLPILTLPYHADGSIPALAKKYSLCVTGSSLNAAAALDGVSLGKDSGSKDRRGLGGGNGGLWDYLDSVAIFARMSPDDKERVLKRLKQQGRHTFMCGDGANDVGALKQAHVGVALLSGFGGANTKKVTPVGGDPAGQVAGQAAGTVVAAAKAETFQEKMQRVKELAAKNKEAKRVEAVARKADTAELMELQKKWFQEELDERTAKGDAWAQFGAMKACTMRMVNEQKQRQAARQKAAGGAMASPGFTQMMQEMEGMEDMETPQVKLVGGGLSPKP